MARAYFIRDIREVEFFIIIIVADGKVSSPLRRRVGFFGIVFPVFSIRKQGFVVLRLSESKSVIEALFSIFLLQHLRVGDKFFVVGGILVY